MKKRPYTNRDPLIRCPHCEGPAQIRRSAQATRLVRDLTAVCDDDSCAHRFAVQIVATHTIQSSLRPCPFVALPLSPRPAPANDTPPLPANDDRVPAADEAVTP